MYIINEKKTIRKCSKCPTLTVLAVITSYKNPKLQPLKKIAQRLVR